MRWFSIVFAAILLFITAHFAYGTLTGSLDEKSIEQRLKPEAEVTIVGGTAPAATTAAKISDIGQQRYEETCKMCHDAGLAGAPKLGDKAEWAPRLAQGIDVLVKHAIVGLKAMPPKGGCTSCTDEEIHKAVEYMVKNAN